MSWKPQPELSERSWSLQRYATSHAIDHAMGKSIEALVAAGALTPETSAFIANHHVRFYGFDPGELGRRFLCSMSCWLAELLRSGGLVLQTATLSVCHWRSGYETYLQTAPARALSIADAGTLPAGGRAHESRCQTAPGGHSQSNACSSSAAHRGTFATRAPCLCAAVEFGGASARGQATP